MAVLRFRAACGCLIPLNADTSSGLRVGLFLEDVLIQDCKLCFGVMLNGPGHISLGRGRKPPIFHPTALGVLYPLHICTLVHTENGKYCEKSFPSQDLVLRIEAKKPWGLKRTYFHSLSRCPHNKVVESWEGIAISSRGCS